MRKNLKWLMTITLLIVLFALLYINYGGGNEDLTTDTETVVNDKDKLLSKSLDESYPITVREVVQLFTRIQKCYYNEDCSSEEIVKLAFMASKLFDEELASNNPFDEYFAELEDEINEYRKEGKTISRVIIGKSSEVEYSTIDKVKYASINCIYYLKSDSGTSKITETYILRKDDEGRWKILGWDKYEPSEWEE